MKSIQCERRVEAKLSIGVKRAGLSSRSSPIMKIDELIAVAMLQVVFHVKDVESIASQFYIVTDAPCYRNFGKPFG